MMYENMSMNISTAHGRDSPVDIKQPSTERRIL